MSSSDVIVYEKDLIDIFQGLQASGGAIVVHSSLSSFGHVFGGHRTLIDSLMRVFSTVMMPAFSWEANSPPPLDERPENNGCDYAFYDNWTKEEVRFLVEQAGIEKSMGIVCKEFLKYPGVLRSDHPWHSWAAWGDLAPLLVKDHPWSTTNLPLEKLADNFGYVLLLGVDLRSCTAVHVAEERAGRRPFYRWMRDRDGNVKRVRASGCAKGFQCLFSDCADVFESRYVGNSHVLCAYLPTLLERLADVIFKNPQKTVCSPECIRCRDALKGGPENLA